MVIVLQILICIWAWKCLWITGMYNSLYINFHVQMQYQAMQDHCKMWLVDLTKLNTCLLSILGVVRGIAFFTCSLLRFLWSLCTCVYVQMGAYMNLYECLYVKSNIFSCFIQTHFYVSTIVCEWWLYIQTSHALWRRHHKSCNPKIIIYYAAKYTFTFVNDKMFDLKKKQVNRTCC